MAANFWRAWWAGFICAVITVAVSLVTEKRPKHELVGLVKKLAPGTVDKNIPFIKRPEFLALIALLLVVILNLIFW
ncbi:MAG: hypothetical protein ABR980_07000 [Ignavibacteriaceae bacterium]|jgi:SSS family solute:Na+ symporter